MIVAEGLLPLETRNGTKDVRNPPELVAVNFITKFASLVINWEGGYPERMVPWSPIQEGRFVPSDQAAVYITGRAPHVEAGLMLIRKG